MSWVFVEPSDVWFFRDARPFVGGEAHAAYSLFPPTPFTTQGAFRSLILGHSNVGWSDFVNQRSEEARQLGSIIGHPRSLGKFKIRGPFRARLLSDGKAELLFPMPHDTYLDVDGNWWAMQPARRTFQSNWPEGEWYPLRPAGQVDENPPAETGLLTQDGLDSYLKYQPFLPLSEPAIYVPERRVGIAIDYSLGRADDQMLYQAEFIRLCQRPAERLGLMVKLEGVQLPQSSGVMSMGGEARASHYYTLDVAGTLPSLPHHLFQAEGSVNEYRFKIVLLTPAWFSSGWQPGQGWSAFFKVPDSAQLRCVATALERPQYIGGWNVASGQHKPLRGFVPAGSVFYFTAAEPITLPEAFSDTPEGSLSLPDQGFGVYASGSWDWLEN